MAKRKWRNERELRGVQSQVQGAINACTDGAYVQLDIKTARNLIEVLEQARHTERASQPPEFEEI